MITGSRNNIGHLKVTSPLLVNQSPWSRGRKFPVLICSQSYWVLGGDERFSGLFRASLVLPKNPISCSAQCMHPYSSSFLQRTSVPQLLPYRKGGKPVKWDRISVPKSFSRHCGNCLVCNFPQLLRKFSGRSRVIVCVGVARSNNKMKINKYFHKTSERNKRKYFLL